MGNDFGFEFADSDGYGDMFFFDFTDFYDLRNFTDSSKFYAIMSDWIKWRCICFADVLNRVHGHPDFNDITFIRKGNGSGFTTMREPLNYPEGAKFKFCVQQKADYNKAWQRDLSYQECQDLHFDVRTGRSAVYPFLYANADPAYLRVKNLHDKTRETFYSWGHYYYSYRWPSFSTIKPRVDYDERMKRDDWQQIRNQVFQRDKHKCRHCGSGISLVCHHITYENLGNESLDDLLTLCRSCHQKVHEEDIRRKGQTE